MATVQIKLFPAMPVTRDVYPIVTIHTNAGNAFAFTGNALPLGRAVQRRTLRIVEDMVDGITTLITRITFPDEQWVEHRLLQRECLVHGTHIAMETHTPAGKRELHPMAEALFAFLEEDSISLMFADAWMQTTGLPVDVKKFQKLMVRSVAK